MNNTISRGGNSDYLLGLTRDGKIIKWLFQRKVQLGDSENFVSISSGTWESLALNRSGRIGLNYSNYDNEFECPSESNFVAVVAEGLNLFALTRDGKIVGWGYNNDIIPEGNNFVAISTGFLHSLALTRGGHVVGWGANDCGQTNCPEGNNFVAIAAGEYHSLALTRDGHVIGWGWNKFDQINCPSGNNFVAISTAGSGSLALTRDGRIVGWGCNKFGQLNCPKDANFISICGHKHLPIALTNEGKIVCWGSNCAYYCRPDPQSIFALPYDFITRLNRNLKALSHMPKYIKMEILEDYTEWEFRDLFYL